MNRHQRNYGDRRILKAAIGLALCLALLPSEIARADLGQVRLSESAGPYHVTVLTSPAPLYAGPLEISVFLQDAETREPVADATVEVVLTSFDSENRPHRPTHLRAVQERDAAGPHYMTRCVLPQAGDWQIEVNITSPAGSETVTFRGTAAPAPARWQTLWPWICWPPVVILLFAIREYTRCQTRKSPPHQGAPT